MFREIEFAPVYTVYNKKYGVFFSERSCALRVTVHGTAYTLSVKVNDYTTALLDTTRVQSDAILSLDRGQGLQST